MQISHFVQSVESHACGHCITYVRVLEVQQNCELPSIYFGKPSSILQLIF